MLFLVPSRQKLALP